MNPEWNVRTASGALVTQLSTLATVLGSSEDSAMKALQADPDLLAAAPARLRDQVQAKSALMEAKAKSKPGGDTPPDIANGSFVSWSGGKGKVDLIVTNGKVPGVDSDVVGTAKSPAARVVVYENDKATGKKIGASTHTLKRIPPLGRARPGGPKAKKSGPAALVSVLADHEAKCDDLGLPTHARLTGYAVKTVYDRGVDAWPGAEVTDLTAEEWAVGRVEHFVKVAAGDETGNVGNDVDLLATEHPAHKPLTRETPPEGTERVDPPEGTERVEPDAVDTDGDVEGKSLAGGGVIIDMAEINADLADLMAAAKDTDTDE